MEGEHTTDELLTKARELLDEDYDPDEDAFFLVITKGGKSEETFSGIQAIVGEINMKTVIAFIISIVTQLCNSLSIHPYVFICRHILSHFVDQERALYNAEADTIATLGADEISEADPSILNHINFDDTEN